MDVWIVRHGEAEPYQDNDWQRQLTVKGRHDIAILGQALHQQQVQPDAILVSPYLRTQQTLALLQAQNHWTAQPQPSDAIVPEASVSRVPDLLEQSGQQVLMVSHQPLVSSLIALLVGGSTRQALHYPMLPGSIAHIRLDQCAPGCGQLLRLQSPPYE